MSKIPEKLTVILILCYCRNYGSLTVGVSLTEKMSSKFVTQKRVNLLEGKVEYQVNTTNKFAALGKGRYSRALSGI